MDPEQSRRATDDSHNGTPDRSDRDPDPPPRQMLDAVDGRLLDPRAATAVAGVAPRSTAYVGPRLMVSGLRDGDDVLGMLREVADPLGWEVEYDVSHRGCRLAEDDDACARRREERGWGGGRLGVSRVTLNVKPGSAAAVPDGWELLQRARARFGVEAM